MTEKDMRLSKMQSSKLGLPGLKMDRYTLVKLGLLAGLGIILLVVGQMGKRSPTANPIPDFGAAGSPKPVGAVSYQEALEQQLAHSLSQVSGAGQVLVQLSLEGGNRVTYATNKQEEIRSTEEKATADGAVRASEERRSETQLVMAREGSTEYPIVVDEFMPVVRGVLVVAEGAKNPFIKEELSQAVQVLLALPAHKVKVLERGE
ncbi:MAG: hypothetical protein GX952_01795 [Firmicutes bacterium]|nr:hypothetical protein [Bacillota bacterium]